TDRAPGMGRADLSIGYDVTGGIALQERLYSLDKALEVLRQGRSQRIEPVNRSKKILHRVRRHDVLDAHRQYRDVFAYGALGLAADLRRRIRARRKYDHHYSTGIDGIKKGGAVFHAGADIARSDPTPDAGRFESRACRVGRVFVFVGI